MATNSPVCSAEDVQRRLEGIITGLMQQMVKALQAANVAVVLSKAAQIEAVHAAAMCCSGAKMNSVDLSTLSPAEAELNGICQVPA